MSVTSVLLIGGSGFIGSHLAHKLAARGLRVIVPTRQYERARHLALLPTAELVEADVFDPATLARLCRGVDAVVNLVGVLHSKSGEPYGRGFAQAHVELPRKLLAACQLAQVPHLLHMSALGAAAHGPSQYQRSKAAGEAVLRATQDGVAVTILRPSVVFGAGDSFLNVFAKLAGLFPVLPLAGANTRFQPVFVEDVVRVILHCLLSPTAAGGTYELAGPKVYTLAELVRYAAMLAGTPRPIIALPEWLAMLQGMLMELAPQPLMSRDNVRSLRSDNVLRMGQALPFGMVPTPLESVAPGYLSPQPGMSRYRRRAGR